MTLEEHSVFPSASAVVGIILLWIGLMVRFEFQINIQDQSE